MKYLLKTYHLLIPIFLLATCTSCNTMNYSHDTKIFSKYLYSTFFEEIPLNQHYYFLITSNSCFPCVNTFMEIMIKQNSKYLANKVTVITTIPDFEKEKFKTVLKILYDDKGDLNYLDLNLYNLSVFETLEGQIVKRYQFNGENKSDFELFLKSIHIYQK